jgi:alpha-galactosidase
MTEKGGRVSSPDDDVVHLHADGVSVVIELSEPLPRVLHWGRELEAWSARAAEAMRATADPPQLNNSIDSPRRFSIWATEYEGWSGTPTHEGHLGGAATTPRMRLTASRHDHAADGTAQLRVFLADPTVGIDVEIEYRLDPSGVLAVTQTLRRRDDVDADIATLYDLQSVLALMPVPARARELLDFTGKWCRERAPQRQPLTFGAHVRDGRRGKPGHDSPYLMTLGVPGFGFRHGELWSLHVGWSGNQRYLAERLPEGAGTHGSVLGGGELLKPGEIRLAPGEAYVGPTCYFGYSDCGLDGISDRFHRMIRRRSAHPTTPRPLLLNTWEAVYFDHDLERLNRLTDVAAAIGLERLVLDDGWFTGRRDETAGLGDWTVDEAVWPNGLAPLADRVHSKGMQFGLWVEPEMLNIDSDLARQHPDWILAPSAGLGPAARHQYVLNLAHDDAWQHVFKHIDRLVTQHSIDFLKWDHNRDLHEAVIRSADGRDRPAVHAQTEALYRLLDALKERHPTLEIESCAGGGGRVDLGILERTDRVWASDCNDPYERQNIQRWTAQLLPPELIGVHVGTLTSHTTARVTSLTFRLATALFGHPGIEIDLTRCTTDEIAQLTAWAALYRELRPLLHSGAVVRGDLDDDETPLHGVVSQDRSEAVYCWARLGTSAAAHAGRVPLPGLDESREYRVRIRTELGMPSAHEIAAPGWVDAAVLDQLIVPGSVLAECGLPMPTLNPGQALLIQLGG